MARIVKEFDERRNEFLDVTQEFFFTVGYKKMSVQMLIERVGVAKGTFYHYFKSKEDLLSQWVFREVGQTIKAQEKIVNDPHLDALSKFNKILQHGRDWKLQHLDLIVSLMKILYHDNNLKLRAEMAKQSTAMAGNLFEKVIGQGVKEGVFKTDYPKEISEKLLKIFEVFSTELSQLVLTHLEQKGKTYDDVFLHIKIWQEIIERILGAPKGAILVVNDSFVESIFNYDSTQNKNEI